MTEKCQKCESCSTKQKYSKWKDPEFMKKYHREKQRERRGSKRHPNILEDGTRWGESRPFGQFDSYEEKLKYMAKYRKYVPKITCDICQGEYYQTQEERHFNSKKHQDVIKKVLEEQKNEEK